MQDKAVSDRRNERKMTKAMATVKKIFSYLFVFIFLRPFSFLTGLPDTDFKN